MDPEPSKPPTPLGQLSPRQRRTVVAAITTLSVAVIVLAAGAVVLGISVFLRTFSAVFLPLVVAGVMALVIKPYQEWFVRRGLRPGLAVALVFLSGFLPAGVGLWFFGRMLVSQVQGLIETLPAWIETARTWIERQIPELVALVERFGLEDRLRSTIERSQDAIVSGLQSIGGGALGAGAWFLGTIGRALAWAVLPVYLVFLLMLRVPPNVEENVLPFLKPETRKDVVFLAREFLAIIVTFFRGQLIVALLMGVLFAVGFSIVGLAYGFLLGVLLGLLNIIPYLGSMVGLAICLPLAFFQEGGGAVKLALVLAVFTLVQLVESYYLTPKIMGQRTGLHPVVVIASFFFWSAALDGILGMVLAVPLTAFLVVFWRLAREKYIEEVV